MPLIVSMASTTGLIGLALALELAIVTKVTTAIVAVIPTTTRARVFEIVCHPSEQTTAAATSMAFTGFPRQLVVERFWTTDVNGP
jgi:hypothetical protein